MTTCVGRLDAGFLFRLGPFFNPTPSNRPYNPRTHTRHPNRTKSAVDSLLASGWQGSMWFPDGFQVTWEGWQGFLQPPQYHVRARMAVCCKECVNFI